MSILLIALLGTAYAGDDSAAWTPGATRQLPQEEGLLLRWDPARSWGTGVLVETLRQVAKRLAFELPNADPLLVGDISRRGGGLLYGHITHTFGADADLGLYTGEGSQPLGGFQDLHPGELDLASNWALIRALLDSDRVAYVLLDQGHIDAIRQYALDSVGLDPDLVGRIFPDPNTRIPWDARGVVRHAPNHQSHMHVHVAAAPGA